jgi:sugar phosphate isomerase/epimerase
VTRYVLGINTCFAVKRWPEPAAWAEIVRSRLGLEIVQHSLDLVDLSAGAPSRRRQARDVRDACAGAGIELHSTFTGLAAYSTNALLHPDPALRRAAERFFSRAIAFTAEAGGRATGGHVGAYSARSWEDPDERAALDHELHASLSRLAEEARRAGLTELYIENMAAQREPSRMEDVERLLTAGGATRVPVLLCLDVGHQVVGGTTGEERDPYAWLRRFGERAPVVHLQQSDDLGDHHWPFTDEFNAIGRIDADRVFDALDASGAAEVTLLLEVIPPFEASDEWVLYVLQSSVEYWRRALQNRHESGGHTDPK